MAVDPEDRQFGGNDGSTDQADIFCSWDRQVPRARDVRVGDRVAWTASSSVKTEGPQQVAANIGFRSGPKRRTLNRHAPLTAGCGEGRMVVAISRWRTQPTT